MITLSDLRINSIYNLAGTFAFQMDLTYFKEFINGGEEKIKLITPLPLSEKWFKKLGFSKTPIQYIRTFEMERDQFLYIDYDSSGYYYHSSGFSVKIEFVHELQNIFYALFKLELANKVELKSMQHKH